MAPRHLLASVSVLLAVALVGCSDDSPGAEPDPTDTPTSVSPTDEETTEEPEKKLGPVQTVRAWVKAYNHLTDTGDATEVRALSTPGCVDCENLFEPILKTYERGGRFEDPGWEVIDANRSPDWPESRDVGAAVRFHSGRMWKNADADPVKYPQEDHILRFDLRRDGEAWLISAVTFLG